MCHESPTAQILGGLVCTAGSVFVCWHIWCYDRGRCLLYSKHSVFRWVIVWMFILSMLFFMVWNIILVWVKYSEYYTVIPLSTTETEILPVPYQLWSAHEQHMVRISYQLLAIAWTLISAIHCEETLYWAYLMSAIRSRTTQTWYQSFYFKLWLLACVLLAGVMPGVVNIETTVLTTMESNVFLAGSSFATVLFGGSMWLLLAFPSFIKESRRQGANPDVIARLQYFKELNSIRTLFRFFYVVCILTLALDGRTKHKTVNSTPFWLDLFCIGGLSSVFASNGLSLMILLPRNMASEAGLSDRQNVFIRRPRPARHVVPHLGRQDGMEMGTDAEGRARLGSASDLESGSASTMGKFHSYSFTTAEGFGGQGVHSPTTPSGGRLSHGPWGELGDALNIDQPYVDQWDQHDDQLQRHDTVPSVHSLTKDLNHVPFAPTGGERVVRDGEVIEDAPARLLNVFRPPADIIPPPAPTDLNIVVMTNTIVEKE